ncbi:MAG: hypothetical protein IJ083_15545 [Clostridia bacterium]|nr:hypothetical protein [Clostridia bacterium]
MSAPLKTGIQPFWFWNGDMREEEILRQIRLMHEQGLSGFLIHPRQGMEIPYLSKSYFDRVRLAVGEAKRLGMEVWLYDEFPYPSGVAAGLVTEDHPEYLCRQLCHETATFGPGEEISLQAPFGRLLLACAYPCRGDVCDFTRPLDLSDSVGIVYSSDVFQRSGLTRYNRKRYFQGDAVQCLQTTLPQLPEGFTHWKVYLFTEAVFRHFKYFETFVDPMQEGAVKSFLENVHERYAREIGDEFGKTVRGFFSDEVTAFPPEQPWSTCLPKWVQERHGIDLIAHLPALFEDMGEITSRVRYAYWETCTHHFIQSYDRQVQEWCHSHGLMYICEKPILRSAELEFVDVPGIDTGHKKVGDDPQIESPSYRASGKIASSAAHFYDKPAALCESFHSIGWGMTIQDMKWIYDWLAISGISWHITHASFYTTDNLRKHDAPASSFYQMPWWQDMHVLSRYVEKKNEFLERCTRQTSILLLDPVTSVWCADASLARKLSEDFARLRNLLLHRGLDFYVIDPLLFEKGYADGSGYHIHDETYTHVILPYMTNLEAGAGRMVEDCLREGVSVLAVGLLPFEQLEDADLFVLGDRATAASLLEAYREDRNAAPADTGKLLFCPDSGALVSLLSSRIRTHFTVSSPLLEAGHLAMAEAVDGGGKYRLFLVNLFRDEGQVLIETDAGKRKICLHPFESVFLSDDDMPERVAQEIPLSVSLSGTFPRRRTQLNALRLGDFEITLKDGQKGTAASVPVINQLEESGLRVPVKTKPYFGCPREMEFPEPGIHLEATFQSLLTPCTRVRLSMEQGTILEEDWSMCLNDGRIEPGDLETVKSPTGELLCADVTSLIRAGENRLSIDIRAKHSFGGLRNPLYLEGDFDVASKDGVFALMPATGEGSIEDIAHTGLPFYAGDITCTVPLHVEDPDRYTHLLFPDAFLQDSMHVTLNGQDLGCVCWSPYSFPLPSGLLKEENQLQVTLSTTLIGRFEGEVFSLSAQRYVPV